MRKGTAEKGNGIRDGDGGERIKNRPIYMLEERYICSEWRRRISRKRRKMTKTEDEGVEDRIH